MQFFELHPLKRKKKRGSSPSRRVPLQSATKPSLYCWRSWNHRILELHWTSGVSFLADGESRNSGDGPRTSRLWDAEPFESLGHKGWTIFNVLKPKSRVDLSPSQLKLEANPILPLRLSSGLNRPTCPTVGGPHSTYSWGPCQSGGPRPNSITHPQQRFSALAKGRGHSWKHRNRTLRKGRKEVGIARAP